MPHSDTQGHDNGGLGHGRLVAMSSQLTYRRQLVDIEDNFSYNEANSKHADYYLGSKPENATKQLLIVFLLLAQYHTDSFNQIIPCQSKQVLTGMFFNNECPQAWCAEIDGT